MNILILEDEKYNYDLLCRLIEDMFPETTIFGPITSITEGKHFFANNKVKIDIIIADIMLNDGVSFSALTDAPTDVPIIFTTAYDEYALKAFEYNSLSYLLKPVDEDDLHDAIRKARERLITDEQRKQLFQAMAGGSNYCERLLVKTVKGEKVIDLSQVRYFTSKEKNTFVELLDGTNYDLNKSLSSIENELNPKLYMRVNRQFIVPLREVQRFDTYTNGKELLVLRGDNAPEIIISRDNRKKIHSWMGEK